MELRGCGFVGRLLWDGGVLELWSGGDVIVVVFVVAVAFLESIRVLDTASYLLPILLPTGSVPGRGAEVASIKTQNLKKNEPLF